MAEKKANSERMSRTELKTALLLAGIYTTRMLGLFLIFPTFSALASGLQNASPEKVGIALGIYSLSQALLQIPAGILSDIFGRKKVLFIGLSLFFAGSLLAALTDDINVVIVARLLQGAGAVSAVCLAFVADSTRGSQHGKVMAIIGMSIAFSFILAFAIGPIISEFFGLQGLFTTITLLSVLALVFAYKLPQPQQQLTVFKIADFLTVAKDFKLFGINIQVFLLHATLSASFFILPLLVKQLTDNETVVYLPAILIAFTLIFPLIRNRDLAIGRMVYFWGVLAVALLGLSLGWSYLHVAGLIVMITLFFIGFTFIEATLPTYLLKVASGSSRGATSGIYAVFQFMGNFSGAVIGSLLYQSTQESGNIHHSFYSLSAIIFIVFINNLVKRKKALWHREA